MLIIEPCAVFYNVVYEQQEMKQQSVVLVGVKKNNNNKQRNKINVSLKMSKFDAIVLYPVFNFTIIKSLTISVYIHNCFCFTYSLLVYQGWEEIINLKMYVWIWKQNINIPTRKIFCWISFIVYKIHIWGGWSNVYKSHCATGLKIQKPPRVAYVRFALLFSLESLLIGFFQLVWFTTLPHINLYFLRNI